MAFQINFMAPVQLTKDGVLPTEGLPVDDAKSSSPQTIPEGCQYVTISHDAAISFSLSDFGGAFPDICDGKTFTRLNSGDISFPVTVGAVLTVADA